MKRPSRAVGRTRGNSDRVGVTREKAGRGLPYEGPVEDQSWKQRAEKQGE
jgi:hypothetical protein